MSSATHPLSIRAAAAEAPEKTALVHDGGAVLSFRQLAEMADAARVAIESHAGARLPAQARVALVTDLTPTTVALLLACWEQRWTPVLVHPRLTAGERARWLADTAPAVVVPEDLELPEAGPPPAATPGASPADEDPLAAVVQTSGTTGAAKAAALARSAFVASAQGSAQNLGWSADDRWLLTMPMAHVGGLSIVTRSLIARRTIVLARLGGEPSRLLEVIERHRVTIASLVPTMLRRLLDAEPACPFPTHVRAVLLGGAATSAALLEHAAQRRVPALTTYGLTEACSQVTTQRYGTRPSPSEGCGPPLQGAELRIVEGEIYVRGAMLMRGYLGPHGEHVAPFDGDGWMATGDLGALDEQGRLHVRGRRKELIVTGGENVLPGEVEAALEEMPEVAAACVFGVPDETWGELVVAAVVPASSDAHREALLRRVAEHTQRVLAAHKRPRRVALVAELILGPSGKLDRRATAQRAAGALLTLPLSR